MKKLTYKYKIIILLAVIILFLIGMFVMGFQVMALRNGTLTGELSQQSLELEILKREQQSVQQGLKDLATLEKSSYPPGGLFSNETNLVYQIQKMESAAELYNIKLSMGISGSSKTAVKAKGVKGELYIIPYIATVNGEFTDIMRFIQAMEHITFITHTNTVTLDTNVETGTTAKFNSEFYIKK